MIKQTYAILVILVCVFWYCDKVTSPIDSGDSQNSYIITLNQPIKVTNSYVSLIWTKYPSHDFKEYRLHKTYPGFEDKRYNDILSISNSVNDTTFTDLALFSDNNYSYTIEVLTTEDSILTSNTINTKTKSTALECDYKYKYEANTVKYFKNFGKMIKGIDSYKSTYWVLLFDNIGGYYDVNDVEIVNYDFVNDTILKKIKVNDTFIWPTGIGYDGEYIWIGFSNNAAINKLYKIDPETGKVLSILNSPQDIDDITYDGEYIYLCGLGNTILKLDPKSENFEQEFKFGQNQINSTGVSYHEEQLWIAFNQGKLIGIYDKNGMQTGFAEVADFKEWNEQPRLSFVENELIVIENGTAKVMSITKK